MSPGPVPPGPLLPAAVFGFLWLALALFVASLLSGCGSTQLPPEKCTPAHQSARLAVCERALKLECELRPELTCPDVAICHEALAKVCPSP